MYGSFRESDSLCPGNYRLGAYGWLAGIYMERAGTPNAGFSDQRLLLQWVQDYIYLVGGDKQQVSAWGESAGAGSIVHHLVRLGGQQDPLFSKAIVQSPAFQWQWDRNPGGTLDQVYKNFSKLVGCGDVFDIGCLRNADQHRLSKANQILYEMATPCTGLFPIGPSVDGDLIQQLPVIAFASGTSPVSLRWIKLILTIRQVLEESRFSYNIACHQRIGFICSQIYSDRSKCHNIY